MDKKTVAIIVSALLLIFGVTFVPRMIAPKKNGDGSPTDKEASDERQPA